MKVDVRVIAATNRDLTEAVKAGSFRSDLLYRLNVFPLEVPPLRSRPADIPLLVNFFLSKSAKKFGKRLDGVSQATMEQLSKYSWPGNVRELENVIERAAILASGPMIQVDESLLSRDDAGQTVTGTLEDVERAHMLRVLQETGWAIEGKHGAAVRLGLHPNTLRSRLQKLGIKKPRPTA